MQVFSAGVQAEKGYGGFLDELQRCEKLGLTRYNFHPGSTTGQFPPLSPFLFHCSSCAEYGVPKDFNGSHLSHVLPEIFCPFSPLKPILV